MTFEQQNVGEHGSQTVVSQLSGEVRGVDVLPVELEASGPTADMKQQYKNYKVLVERTAEVFGDGIKAARWLSTPSVDFGNLVPIQVAQDVDYSATELERLFEPVFIRIEHGIYT